MVAPYRSADQAFRQAYGCEARDVCKVSTFLADLRGSSVQARSGLTPWDKLTEAAMIITLMRETLSESQRDIIDLYYTVPNDVVLENRVERLARLLSYKLSLSLPAADRWYICDVVREWAGGKGERHMTDVRWAKKLKVNPSTLYRWRAGRRGVMAELDRLLAQARGTIESVMIERGVVETE